MEHQPDPREPDSAPPAVPPPPLGDPWGILRVAVPVYGVVLLFAFGFAFFGAGVRTVFGESKPTGPHLLVGLGLGLALVVLSRVAVRAWPPMERLADGLADLLGPLPFLPALLLALVSGVAEEVLFRGALWPQLGLVGTTLLFGLVHFWPRRAFWVYPLFAVVAGLLFGLLRQGTESVWPPVAAHVVVNALNLFWIGRRARRRRDG